MNAKEYATKYAGATIIYNNKENIIIGYSVRGDNCIWMAGDWAYSIEDWIDNEGEEINLVIDIDRKTKANGIDLAYIEKLIPAHTENEIKELIKALEL